MLKRVMQFAPWVLLAIVSGVLAFVLAGNVDWPKVLDDWRANVVLVSAGIAAISLSFAAWSYARTKTIERRTASLAAWQRWSTELREERMLINMHWAGTEVEDHQAEALATPGMVFKDRDGRELTRMEKAVLLDSVLAVLNGLEHLAVGVKYRLFRDDVLIIVGGTVILSMWRRFRPYVEYTRRGARASTSQRRAWLQLERLAARIERQREREDRETQALSD